MSELRIVSFLPSATEMVCALGLADRLVGTTHECASRRVKLLERLHSQWFAA